MVRLSLKIAIISCVALISYTPSLMVAADSQECANPDMKSDPSCPTRPHIIKCAAKYLDLNKNDKLERSELETAINGLSWLSRGVLKVIGSIDKIMAKCDADGDDAIGILTDMPATEETCLASCFKRKAFKGAFFPDCDLPDC